VLICALPQRDSFVTESALTSDNNSRPTHLEASSHFLHDALDFKMRYRRCALTDEALSFTHIKPQRCNCFIDLRMCVGEAPQSLVAYHVLPGYNGKSLIEEVEGYGHRVDRLYGYLMGHLTNELVDSGSRSSTGSPNCR